MVVEQINLQELWVLAVLVDHGLWTPGAPAALGVEAGVGGSHQDSLVARGAAHLLVSDPAVLQAQGLGAVRGHLTTLGLASGIVDMNYFGDSPATFKVKKFR